MKKLLTVFFLLPLAALSQLNLGIGVKAGVNFADIKDAADVNTDSRTGFMIGGYIAPGKKKTVGFRSEIILSRQGYNYQTSTNTGSVNLDYLLLPQLLTIHFTRFVQVQAGGQLAFLLNTGVDSTGSSAGSLFDYFKRFDYGLAGGAEIFPFLGFFAGARLNISLSNANETAPGTGNWPNFVPRINARNNVVQVYAGWRF